MANASHKGMGTKNGVEHVGDTSPDAFDQDDIANVIKGRNSLHGNDQELYPYSFDFHADRFAPGLARTTDLLPYLRGGDVWAYVDEQSLREVRALGRPVEVLRSLGKFPASQLRIEFLNPATRPQVLQPVYFVRVRGF